MAFHGIDVSHFQGQVDWTKVAAAGMQFVYTKATQSTSMTDSERSTS